VIAGRMVRETDQASVADPVWRTRNAWERLRGLLGRPRLGRDEGLLLSPCHSIHTIGMGYAIDVVYLSDQGEVLKVCGGLPPLRLSRCRGAAMTLELAAGACARHGLEPGQRLQWSPYET